MNPFEPVGWGQSRARRFFPTLLLFGVLGVLGVVALIGPPDTDPRPGPSQTPLPASPVEGLVVAVDSPSLGKVNGFALLLEDGQVLELGLGPLENATEFSPSHLGEHMASSEPIRAFYRLEDGRPVVYRLEDAPVSSGSPSG